MSSYWSAYYGTGLVLSESEFETFLNNYSVSENRTPHLHIHPMMKFWRIVSFRNTTSSGLMYQKVQMESATAFRLRRF